MSGFFSTARDAAAAEFGRRNYRTFAFLAWARRLAPFLSSLVTILVVVAAAGGLSASRESWLPYMPQIVVVASVVAGVSLLLAFTVWVWRNRWRWQRW
ncbi:hypothetical protein [Micromonospora sp. URMC 103]|uniref:hypothetical protein n=1 Tax=Micromonospora sp. URMC 103 TaxID=3423406 RepID=UPI003F1C451C